MPLLFSMSLFGTIAAVIYLFIEPLAKRHFSVTWRRTYLICNILCFVFPFQYFFGVGYRNFLSSVYRKVVPQKPVEKLPYEDMTGDIIQISPQGIYMEDAYIYVLLVGSVIIGLVLLYHQLRKYQMIKKYLTKNQQAAEREGMVSILRCEDIDTPFTIGIRKPMIVIPDIEWQAKDLAYVVEHEMTHIRQRDNFIKLLALVMICIHFYNPFAYYILYKWGVVAELCCDAKVLAGKKKEEVNEYGLLVIRMAEDKREHRLLPVMGFNIQKKEMEERIKTMKRIYYAVVWSIFGYVVRYLVWLVRNARTLVSGNYFIIVGTPQHGNLGDQAIALAEYQLFSECDKEKAVIEIPSVIMYKAKWFKKDEIIRYDSDISISDWLIQKFINEN